MRPGQAKGPSVGPLSGGGGGVGSGIVIPSSGLNGNGLTQRTLNLGVFPSLQYPPLSMFCIELDGYMYDGLSVAGNIQITLKITDGVTTRTYVCGTSASEKAWRYVASFQRLNVAGAIQGSATLLIGALGAANTGILIEGGAPVAGDWQISVIANCASNPNGGGSTISGTRFSAIPKTSPQWVAP
jgi:hypothetical protein